LQPDVLIEAAALLRETQPAEWQRMVGALLPDGLEARHLCLQLCSLLS
jgi:hypothetical protein